VDEEGRTGDEGEERALATRRNERFAAAAPNESERRREIGQVSAAGQRQGGRLLTHEGGMLSFQGGERIQLHSKRDVCVCVCVRLDLVCREQKREEEEEEGLGEKSAFPSLENDKNAENAERTNKQTTNRQFTASPASPPPPSRPSPWPSPPPAPHSCTPCSRESRPRPRPAALGRRTSTKKSCCPERRFLGAS
jgi:hypothetical protein